MPPIPSGSYFALGFGMTSTRSTLSAGIWRRRAARNAPRTGVGRPLIWMTTFWLPRSEMLPSVSTSRDGSVWSVSMALPPAVTACSFTL